MAGRGGWPLANKGSHTYPLVRAMSTLKDKIAPGSRAAPAFITTPAHKIECTSLQPSSIVTSFQMYEPSIETLEPILQPSPIIEFEILVLLPMVVPLPIKVKGPISAVGDCLMSGRTKK